MKTFEKFLTESQKPIKGFGDAQFKTGTFDMANTQGQLRKKNEREITKRIENLANKNKKNVIPDSKPPVTRFDPTEPFMDDDLGQRTGKTGDKVKNKPVTQTGSKIIDKSGKTVAYKGKNVPVTKSTPGSTQLTGIKDADLDKLATDTARKNLVKQQQISNLTQPQITSSGGKIEQPKIDVDDIKKFKTGTTKPRTRVVSYTTTPKTPTDVVGTVKRGLERTGLKTIKPKEKVGTKVKNIAKSKVTKNIIKKTPKRLVFNRALSGLGRVAGGAFAVKDFMDTARKEKALGRSKTAARLRGASKAIGGYIGGGIGALAGGLAGGGVASAGLGIAGGIAGYQAGSKIGDQIYKTGRNLVTGKKTFKNLRKDINKGAGNLLKGAGSVFKSPSER